MIEMAGRKGAVFKRVLWVQERSVEVFGRYPWGGWAVWLISCVNSLVRTTPRRFGSTFEAYLIAAHHFWQGQQILRPADDDAAEEGLGGAS